MQRTGDGGAEYATPFLLTLAPSVKRSHVASRGKQERNAASCYASAHDAQLQRQISLWYILFVWHCVEDLVHLEDILVWSEQVAQWV